MSRPRALTDYLAQIGSKGGKATGKSKVRGDSDWYAKISRKAAKKRAELRASGKLPRRSHKPS